MTVRSSTVTVRGLLVLKELASWRTPGVVISESVTESDQLDGSLLPRAQSLARMVVPWTWNRTRCGVGRVMGKVNGPRSVIVLFTIFLMWTADDEGLISS